MAKQTKQDMQQAQQFNVIGLVLIVLGLVLTIVFHAASYTGGVVVSVLVEAIGAVLIGVSIGLQRKK